MNAPIILHISTEKKLSEITQSATDLASAPNASLQATASECTSSLAYAKFFPKKDISIILDNYCA